MSINPTHPGAVETLSATASIAPIEPDAYEAGQSFEAQKIDETLTPEAAELIDRYEPTLDAVQRFLAPIANRTDSNKRIFEWFIDNRDTLAVELAIKAAHEGDAANFDIEKFSAETTACESLKSYLLTQHFAQILHARRVADASKPTLEMHSQEQDSSPFNKKSYAKMTKKERQQALPAIVREECLKLGMLEFLLEKQGYVELFPEITPRYADIHVPGDGANKQLLWEQFGISYDETVGGSELLQSLKATLEKGASTDRTKETSIRLARQELGIIETIESANIEELKQLRLKWSRRLEDEVVYTTMKKTDDEIYAELDEKSTLLGMEILDLSGRGDTQALLEEELLEAFKSQSYTTLVKALQGFSAITTEGNEPPPQQYLYFTETIFQQLFDLSKPDRYLSYAPNTTYLGKEQQLLYAAEYVSLLECLKTILKQRKNIAQTAMAQVVIWQESVRPAAEQLAAMA